MKLFPDPVARFSIHPLKCELTETIKYSLMSIATGKACIYLTYVNKFLIVHFNIWK